MKIYYNPKLTYRASKLRRRERTYAEKLLWCYLRNRQVHGYKFMRQKPVGNFIVDFFCPELKLVIEIDGISHEGKEYYDQKRVNYFESLGLTVLRFTDDEMKDKTESVYKKIDNFASNPTTPPFIPLIRGETFLYTCFVKQKNRLRAVFDLESSLVWNGVAK